LEWLDGDAASPLRDRSPARVEHDRADFRTHRLLANVVERRFDWDEPAAVGPLSRMGVHAVGDDMDRRTLYQPGVPINPAALVPPALKHARIHADGNDIGLAAEVGERRQVEVGAVIAAEVVANDIAVEPH